MLTQLGFACRRFGRLDVQLLSCLNGILLAYGSELRPHMATLHRPLQDYIKHAWGERTPKLKVWALAWMAAGCLGVLAASQTVVLCVCCCTFCTPVYEPRQQQLSTSDQD